MHARLITAQAPVENVDIAVARSRQATAKIREQPGCRGSLLLVDRDSGKAIALTLWEDRDSMLASEGVSSAERTETAQTASGQIVGLELFEVAELVVPHDAFAGREDF